MASQAGAGPTGEPRGTDLSRNKVAGPVAEGTRASDAAAAREGGGSDLRDPRLRGWSSPAGEASPFPGVAG